MARTNPTGRHFSAPLGTQELLSASDRQVLKAYSAVLRDVLQGTLSQFTGEAPRLTWGTAEVVPGPKIGERFPGEYLVLQTGFAEGLGGNLAVSFPVSGAVALLKSLGVEGTEIGDAEKQALTDAIGLAVTQAHERLSRIWGTSIESNPLQSGVGLMDAPGTFAGDLNEEPEMVLIPCRIEATAKESVPFNLHISTSMLESMADAMPGGGDTLDSTLRPVSVARPAEFEELAPSASDEEPRNLGLLMDIPLEVRVELGRAKLKIHDVLELGNGSVVELDRLAGEPVDLMVNGKLFAKGEVVVIDENFGIRITDVVNITERLEALK